MSENEIKNLMEKYLNGTITEKEEKRLESFDRGLLSANEDSVFRNNFHRKLVKKRLTSAIDPKQSNISTWKWVRIAASIVLLLSIGFLAYNRSNANLKEEPVREMVQNTTWGQKMDLTLADGSKVRLNSGSTLKFPENFEGNTREVELIGEAFFEVAEDPDKPFIIRSSDIRTRVLGTTFNVSAYPDNEEVAVTLATGKVRVASKDSTVTLLPDQQLVYNRSDHSLNTFQVDVNRYIDWKNGIIHIEDASLPEAVEVLERWYGVTFVFEDESFDNCHITATYDNQTLATVLESIKYVKKGLEYEFLESAEILIKGSCTDY